MSRIPRIDAVGIPYHVTQRGNARQQIFFEKRDYSLYLDLLRHHTEQADLRIWAYCLMPNHIHLIAMPDRPAAMADAMRGTHADFARYFNLRRRSCGHVWQARYFSTPLDANHLWQAMAYIERKPVRAHLAELAEDYAWSSARFRRNASPHNRLLDLAPWREQYDWPRWKIVLQTSIAEEAFGQRLQEASRRGRPLGEEPFVDDLETRCGRRLRALPVGRPKRESNEQPNQLGIGIGV